LAALPLSTWLELYGAVMAERYESLATLVGIIHPKSPPQAQRQLLRAARAALRGPATPIWQDPARFRAWLGAVPGVAVEGAASPPEAAEADAHGDAR
jgi:hypothetical protein